jgi:predicted aminopeptidase
MVHGARAGICSVMLLSSLVALNGCYLAKQGYYVLKYQYDAKSVPRLLADRATSDSLKSFLVLTERVRRYAIDSIGLRTNRNYTTFVSVNKPYLLDVVCASAPDTFRPFNWRYPFFGAFPYQGYFEKRDAQKEALRLEKKGYDVLVRDAGAFSSLGILRDPLYSFMEKYPLLEIASIIIHEQTHATVFLRSHADFNEQLATFVGDQGALAFIRDCHGDSSAEYRRAVDQRSDFDVFMASLRALHDTLDSVYKSVAGRSAKLARKKEIVDQYRARLLRDRLAMFRTPPYQQGFTRTTINNAYILSYMTYVQDLSLFYRLYEKNGQSLRATVDQLKGLRGYRGDPAKKLREMLGG